MFPVINLPYETIIFVKRKQFCFVRHSSNLSIHAVLLHRRLISCIRVSHWRRHFTNARQRRHPRVWRWTRDQPLQVSSTTTAPVHVPHRRRTHRTTLCLTCRTRTVPIRPTATMNSSPNSVEYSTSMKSETLQLVSVLISSLIFMLS